VLLRCSVSLWAPNCTIPGCFCRGNGVQGHGTVTSDPAAQHDITRDFVTKFNGQVEENIRGITQVHYIVKHELEEDEHESQGKADRKLSRGRKEEEGSKSRPRRSSEQGKGSVQRMGPRRDRETGDSGPGVVQEPISSPTASTVKELKVEDSPQITKLHATRPVSSMAVPIASLLGDPIASRLPAFPPLL